MPATTAVVIPANATLALWAGVTSAGSTTMASAAEPNTHGASGTKERPKRGRRAVLGRRRSRPFAPVVAVSGTRATTSTAATPRARWGR